MIKVLFVCLGNICRSPMAEGMFRKLVEEGGLAHAIAIDSAGTHAYHIGDPPDERAIETSARRNVDISGLRGRRATREDIEQYDYILAMDVENYRNLRALSPPGSEHKIKLFLEFATRFTERSVPDPYFGDPHGFDRVLDMIEDAAAGLFNEVRGKL